jgi:hypothetical protein
MIWAIGDRMAYEAVVNMGIDSDLLALYEAGVVKTDSSWYVEHLGLSRASRSRRSSSTVGQAFGSSEHDGVLYYGSNTLLKEVGDVCCYAQDC